MGFTFYFFHDDTSALRFLIHDYWSYYFSHDTSTLRFFATALGHRFFYRIKIYSGSPFIDPLTLLEFSKKGRGHLFPGEGGIETEVDYSLRGRNSDC
jgi:hypothetical protein